MTRQNLLAAALSIILLPAGAAAQTGASTIAGVVRDTTGAVLPGVTVETSSPAMLADRATVTEGNGSYTIPELRPGVYTIVYTLPGFATVRREGLELSASFTASVNIEMRVGGLEETVTVAGASPVVDIQNVRQQNVFSREMLDSLPTTRSVAGFATLTLGATLNNPQNQSVGGDQSEALSSSGFSIHGGRSSDQKLLLNGMAATDASFRGNTNRNAINAVAVQETVFQVGGITAEGETGGVQINVIPKEGGNNFSYYVNASGAGEALQSENLSDEVRDRGLTTVASLKRVYDVGFAAGGPISRDRIWFFGATRYWGSQKFAAGNFFNARQGIELAPGSGVTEYVADPSQKAFTNGYLRDIFTARITFQATEKQRWSFSKNLQANCDCYRNVDGALAPEAVRQRIYGPSGVAQAAWNYPVSNRVLLEGGSTFSYYLSKTGRAPGTGLNTLSIRDRDSRYRWGSAVSSTTNYAPKYKIFDQWNQRFVVSLITGAHAFKTGVTMQQGWNRDRSEMNHIPGTNIPVSYEWRDGAPSRLIQYTELENNQNLKANLGLFVQDQWTANRLTMNLGLRYSYYNAYVPSQTIRAPKNRDSYFFAPEFGPDGIVFDERNKVPEWSDFQPRVGAAFDVFGTGKTAIKASVGRYVAYEGLTGIPRDHAPGRELARTSRRNWSDDNGNLIPDCDLRNQSANGECGRGNRPLLGTQVPGRTYDDNVIHDNRAYNWQESISIQQELVPGFALNVGYFRTEHFNFNTDEEWNKAWQGALFDSYCVTAPTDARLGDSSGQQICGLVDLRSSDVFDTQEIVTTQVSTLGERTEVYNGVDIGVTGRYGQGGIVTGGVAFGRTVNDQCDAVRNAPEFEFNGGRTGDRFCHTEDANQSQFKLAANYPLPVWGLELSGTYQNLPGIPIFATLEFDADDPEIVAQLGRELQDDIEINILQPFTEFGERVSQLDLRLAKSINLGNGRIRGQFDVYNVFNAGTILAQNGGYGGTYARPENVLGGRLVKFGLTVDFN